MISATRSFQIAYTYVFVNICGHIYIYTHIYLLYIHRYTQIDSVCFIRTKWRGYIQKKKNVFHKNLFIQPSGWVTWLESYFNKMMYLGSIQPGGGKHSPACQFFNRSQWRSLELEKSPTVTLQGTNISPKNGILKMIFLFPRWDMLIPWRVFLIGKFITSLVMVGDVFSIVIFVFWGCIPLEIQWLEDEISFPGGDRPYIFRGKLAVKLPGSGGFFFNSIPFTFLQWWFSGNIYLNSSWRDSFSAEPWLWEDDWANPFSAEPYIPPMIVEFSWLEWVQKKTSYHDERWCDLVTIDVIFL